MKAIILALFLISAVTALENGVYVFLSNQTGQALDIIGADQKENAALVSYPFRQGKNQQFVLKTDDKKKYTISALHSSKTLTAVDKKDSNIVQRTYKKSSGQQWTIHPKANGLVAIRNVATGKYLTVRDKALDKVYQDNGNGKRTQLFRPIRVDKRRQTAIVHDGIYAFLNTGLKRALDIQDRSKKSGAKLAVADFKGITSQYFQIRGSRSNPEFVRIAAVHTGKVLTSGPRGITQEDKRHGNNAQLWTFYDGQDGTYSIENKGTKKVLTLAQKSQNLAYLAPFSTKNEFQQFIAVRIA